MSLADDLAAQVKAIFSDIWTDRKGTVVPEPDSLTLGNDAVRLDGTVLYADLAESTSLVDKSTPEFAAEIYKSYLHCAAKIIRAEGGAITSYDGDRIMSVFIGDTKNTSAVRAGLKINYACTKIINPAIRAVYANSSYTVRQTVGIDTSALFVANTGIRGSRDLVWVGRAANHAAKLTTLSDQFPTWISGEVYDNMHRSAKVASDGRSMWEEKLWTPMNNRRIFSSTWWHTM
jgi:class 3 adenylate cyclase